MYKYPLFETFHETFNFSITNCPNAFENMIKVYEKLVRDTYAIHASTYAYL